MAQPADGITLGDKRQTTDALLRAGADIHALNTVRKHLSSLKGGQLAAATPSTCLTLAVSDVVGDDLGVIGSGPTVADGSTFAEARAIVGAAGLERFPATVIERLERGARGEIAETPKPGDRRLARSTARVVGSRVDAMRGAARQASRAGYAAVVLEAPVTGEARGAAARHAEAVLRVARGQPRPLCVISTGETTVKVTGAGTGGRNQEFALAAAALLDSSREPFALASLGTDGIDGPTDAAGAIIDTETLSRARAAGLDPDDYLRDNNSYAFFDRLGDLIRTGPTGTNVGDLQVILLA